MVAPRQAGRILPEGVPTSTETERVAVLTDPEAVELIVQPVVSEPVGALFQVTTLGTEREITVAEGTKACPPPEPVEVSAAVAVA